ncbi:MAG TPA: hypothetical protein VL172_04685, partial [Kofleriaceae bacterium]|nr:hypothetical protein [Kofleriaceae bacterium]
MDPASALMTLFNPFAPERADPYPTYAAIREAAPIFRTPMGGFMVTRYETADRLIRSALFRTPRGYRTPDDPAGPSRWRCTWARPRAWRSST